MPLDIATILDAYDTLREPARKRWLLSIPTHTDLNVLRYRTADRLGIEEAQVQAAIDHRGEIVEVVSV